jgi:hypothetical protein
MLQIAACGKAGSGFGWSAHRRDTKHDLDAVAIDLDPANEGVDDLARAVPVEAVEALIDFGGKVFEPTDHERELAFGIGSLDGGFLLLPDLRHALLEPCNARFKLSLVEEAPGVAVDQAIDAAPKRGHLTIKPRDLPGRTGSVGCLPEAPSVLGRHPARILQQGPHPIPYHMLKLVSAHR